MTPQPGHAVRTPAGDGYISAVLAGGLLGVVVEAGGKPGYGFVRDSDVQLLGPHPEQWDAHSWQRMVTAAFG